MSGVVDRVESGNLTFYIRRSEKDGCVQKIAVEYNRDFYLITPVEGYWKCRATEVLAEKIACNSIKTYTDLITELNVHNTFGEITFKYAVLVSYRKAWLYW